MKREFVFGFVALSLCLIFVSSVSAYSYYLPPVKYVVQNVIDTWVDTLQPILQALFGGYGWSGYFLFERLLLFILLVSIVFLAVGRVPVFQDRKAIKWVIAIIVPLIGIRFMNFEWLTAIFLQYEVLAIVLVSVLPFILYFFFLSSVLPGTANVFMRRFGWALFAAVYFGLWSTEGSSARSEIYLWTMVVSLIMIFFDKYMEDIIEGRERKKSENSKIWEYITSLDRIIQEIQMYSSAPPREKAELIKQLEEQRKVWKKKL